MTGRMDGKVVLITGSTDGIGKQTAIQLARMGATVLIHGRDRQRTAAAASEIGKATGKGDIRFFAADLAEQEDVRRLADEVSAASGRLDVLINNAGVYMNERVLTPDGLETTFAVNHLAPFLLTSLLLDLLRTSAPSRIVNVSSVAHQRGDIDFTNLQGERTFSPYGAYAMSKLADLLFTGELAKRLAVSGVTVNSLHPGVIDTKLLRMGFGIQGDTPEEGAETSVYLASSPDLTATTGLYFVKARVVKPSPHASDRRLRNRLWTVSEELTGIAGRTAASAQAS